MTAPIGFTASVSTTVPSTPAPSAPCGRAPAPPTPFDTLTVPQYDQLRDKLLTTRLETLQDWAQKEFPHFQPPPRQAWLDLYTRTLLQIIREERPATKELDQLLLEKYPSSLGFRIADTAIAGVQRHLDEAIAQPQPDAKQIKIWFTLLIEQEKVDIDRHRYGMKPPASKLSEAQIRKEMWDILGIPIEDQNRVEAEIQADRAKEAAAASEGAHTPSRAVSHAPVAHPDLEPAPDDPDRPFAHATDLLGQPLDQTPTRPSTPANPAHPFSPFMAAPLDPSARTHAAVSPTVAASPNLGDRPLALGDSQPEHPTDPSDPFAHPSTQKTGGGAPMECGSSLPLSHTPTRQPQSTPISQSCRE